MATLKKYNLSGKELGDVKVPEAFKSAEANSQMVKDYIVALRANARQWSASTKTRAEVVHTTKKPHPQKGTGRARQGSLVSPQYRGGGRVHTPRPKFDQHVRINKKERQAAIRTLLAEKINDNKVHIIDSTELNEPKTKAIASFLKSRNVEGRILFLGESNFTEVETEGKKAKVSIATDAHSNFQRSMRNLPKTEFRLASNVSGYDLLIAKELVLTESAFKELNDWLGGTGE